MRQKDRKTEQKNMKSLLKSCNCRKNSEKRKSGTYGTKKRMEQRNVWNRRMGEERKYVWAS